MRPRGVTITILLAAAIILGLVLCSRDADAGARQLCRNPNITGSNQDDVLLGTGGNDIIRGDGGDDSIFGFGGNDRLCGGKGRDRLIGGDGNDSARGGRGNDVCSVEHPDSTCE